MSLEGIRKGYLVSVKNSICKGTVLDLGAEPPRINFFEYPPPPPVSLFTGCSERVLSGESSEVERKKRSTFGCYLCICDVQEVNVLGAKLHCDMSYLRSHGAYTQYTRYPPCLRFSYRYILKT